jgi:ATP phosphoribosyltransferase regulatory subunit
MTDANAPLARLLALMQRAGYQPVDTPVLQPVDIFLELSGEDIRRRLFTTQDGAGRDMCLRPEFTIPVCRQHLAAGGAERASYAYGGTVFRHRAQESGEFLQAGIESFGRTDKAAADAEVLGLALEASAALGLPRPVVRMGDIGLIDALLGALSLSPTAQRRIRRAVAAGRPWATGLDEAKAPTAHAGILSTLAGADPAAARAFVEDMLSMNGARSVGGRSTADIAERFLSRAAGDEAPGAEQRAVLDRFFALAGTPDDIADGLRALACDAGLAQDSAIGPALDQHEARTGFLAARGIDVATIHAATAFARNLDYYTGLVFEITRADAPDVRPLIGGGRYDTLLRRLGSVTDIPAVGCAIWVERFPGGTR